MNPLRELMSLMKRHGTLREADLRALSDSKRIPLHEIESLCSFYPFLRRTPPKRFRVRGCRDLACQLRGASRSLEQLRRACEPKEDVEFESASCLGRCDSAPACTINDIPHSVGSALARIEDDETSAPRPQAARSRRFRIDPYANPEERFSELKKWVEVRVSGDDPGPRLIERLKQSELRGMGGAGFPTGIKWERVRATPSTPRFVICNADESEPGTFKDRVILENLPHLIIEGMILAGLAVGSARAWIYIRHEYQPEIPAIEAALEEARRIGALGKGIFGSDFDFEIEIFISPGGYILGEETALLEALEGRRGEPRNKPPYPGSVGLYGQPTLINNVESFAQLPRGLREGQAEFKFYSVSGDVEHPDVVEAPLGSSTRELIERCGGMRGGAELLAFLPGGASTGFLPASEVDRPLDWESLAEIGSSLGSAAVLVVAEGADLWRLAGNLTAFFRNESCGKCVPCRVGTEKALILVEEGKPDAPALLEPLHETLRDTSICGLGQVALEPILSVIKRFPEHCPKGGERR